MEENLFKDNYVNEIPFEFTKECNTITKINYQENEESTLDSQQTAKTAANTDSRFTVTPTSGDISIQNNEKFDKFLKDLEFID